ncbi:hypothetical protein [Rheinheimera sp. 4Y26]|nr:hypothetical protein [Rheinheimera sp. 4Y26]MCT6700936.1 hypothetical protein [Rheinheimera sp. 4Y26]
MSFLFIRACCLPDAGRIAGLMMKLMLPATQQQQRQALPAI